MERDWLETFFTILLGIGAVLTVSIVVGFLVLIFFASFWRGVVTIIVLLIAGWVGYLQSKA